MVGSEGGAGDQTVVIGITAAAYERMAMRASAISAMIGQPATGTTVANPQRPTGTYGHEVNEQNGCRVILMYVPLTHSVLVLSSPAMVCLDSPVLEGTLRPPILRSWSFHVSVTISSAQPQRQHRSASSRDERDCVRVVKVEYSESNVRASECTTFGMSEGEGRRHI